MFHHPHRASVPSFTVKCPEACTFQDKCARITLLKLHPKRNVSSECCILLFKLYLKSKPKNVKIFIQLLHYKVIKFISKVNWNTFLHLNMSGIATHEPSLVLVLWWVGLRQHPHIHAASSSFPFSRRWREKQDKGEKSGEPREWQINKKSKCSLCNQSRKRN